MLIVNAPEIEEAPYGLLSLPNSVENMSDDQFADWSEYEQIRCRVGVMNEDICDQTKRAVVTSRSTQTGTARQYGFSVVVSGACSTFGFGPQEREHRVMKQLDVCTQKAVENELWTGAVATAAGHTTNHWLASTSATDVTPGGGAIKVRYGIALLEKAIADMGCGARGVIHMTRDVASTLFNTKAIDGHLETPIGNYISAGSGYTGSAPNGTAATSVSTWLYATGLTKVMLGEGVIVGESTSQRTNLAVNTITTIAQRAAWVDFDSCSWFAVNVNLALDLG